LRTAAFTKEASHLLCNSLFIGRAQHACGIDPVLLRKLAGTRVNSPLVEDLLHRFEDVLTVRRCRGIRVLLAAHDDFHNFSQLYRWQVFGLLNLVDLRFPVVSDSLKPRIQIVDALVSRVVGVANDPIRFRDFASLISAPREGIANRVSCHSLLKVRAERSRELLTQLV
jgi:hypothetical protein